MLGGSDEMIPNATSLAAVDSKAELSAALAVRIGEILRHYLGGGSTQSGAREGRFILPEGAPSEQNLPVPDTTEAIFDTIFEPKIEDERVRSSIFGSEGRRWRCRPPSEPKIEEPRRSLG